MKAETKLISTETLKKYSGRGQVRLVASDSESKSTRSEIRFRSLIGASL